MQNYKVEVQNHSEAMEAQDLFLKMGFRKELFSYSGYPKLVITDIDSIGGYSSGAEIGYLDADKITLQELRSMVTPKQKEYLVKTDTGYTLQVLSDLVDGHDGIIEVPDGAMKATLCNEFLIFWKNDFLSLSTKNGDTDFTYDPNDDYGFDEYMCVNDDASVIWQRESLNDQVASAEEYRKSFTHTPKSTLDVINNMQDAFNKAQNMINASNAMAKLFTYPQYLSGVVHGKEFIVKPNNKRKDESDLVNDGQSIMDGLVDGLKSTGFSEGGFIPNLNHGAPVGLLHHGFSGFTQPEELPFVSDNAWSKQVGGDHYKKLAIQPMEYALQNKLDYAQANVVKYVTRHADKNGKQDLLKAIHNIELMIAHYYSDQE